MAILRNVSAVALMLLVGASAFASEGFPNCELSFSLAPKQDGSVDTVLPSSLNQSWKYVGNYDSDMIETSDLMVQVQRAKADGTTMIAITNKKNNTSSLAFVDLTGRSQSGKANLEVRDGSLSYDGKALISMNVECENK